MWRLAPEDVPALALGAAMLGGGGGGSTRVAELIATRLLHASGGVDVVAPNDLPAPARVAPLGLVGSVTVFEEKPPNGDEVGRAVRALERYTGVRLSAVLPFECAGVNAVLAVCAAALLRLPLVDADGMGRAFPQIDQTTFTLNDIPIAPAVLADEKGSLLVIDGVDHFLAEEIARANVVTLGGWSMVVLASQSAADIARVAIGGTVSRAVEIGRLLLDRDLAGVLSHHAGRALFRGRVVEVMREGRGRFAGGGVVLHAPEADRYLRVEFQNENMVVLEGGIVRACVPDIICLLDVERAVPLTSERLRYGMELDVVVLAAPAAWRTQAGLGLVGPRAFGYDMPYVIPKGEV